jgi:signal transduction histidine kinase
VTLPGSSRNGAAAGRPAPAALTAVLRRLQPRRPHLEIIIALLVLVFGLTGWLAYEAAATAREARQRAEDTLENYAQLAADAVVEHSQQLAYQTWRRVFRDVLEAEREGLEPARVLERLDYAEACGCDAASISRTFVIHGDDRAAGSASDLAFADELRDHLLAGFLASVADGWAVGSAFLGSGDIAIYSVRFLTGGGFRAYGIVGDRTLLAPYFAWAGRDRELLPHRHVQERNLDFVRVTVRRGDGRLLHEHGNAGDDAFAASALTASVLPPLEVRVAIDRSAADTLLFGGMPHARLPLLFALLALTAALLAAALLLLRRETELTRLRGEFVASVSHELRTPLAQIRMFAETLMLGRTRSDGDRRRALEIIDQEARRLSSLVENVLLFARAERRRVTLVTQPVPLGDEIRDAIDGFLPFCRSRNVRIRPELEDGVIAPVDRHALRQILLNLLDNALKYGPAGQEITVGLAVFGTAARVWVDDEGPGIPAASRERIFDPF